MRITATQRAAQVVERASELRSGTLTITLGTGCCESTAPFLYEDFWPGPDQEEVGEVAGVRVFAPAYLRELYPDDQTMAIDVVEELGESLSVETELGCRLALRDTEAAGRDKACVAPQTTAELTGRAAALPEHLQGLRIR